MRLVSLAVVFALVSGVASAAEVAGIAFEERMKLGTSELVLNGSGLLRKRAFFKVYVAGLYLTEKRTSPLDVLGLPGPKRVSITLLRNLPVENLVAALNDGIRNNSSPEEQRATKSRIEALVRGLRAVRHCRKGDVITFDWSPESGTSVILNGEVRGAAIQGDDAYRALLRVWLGDRPTNAGLKRALLGVRD